MQAVYYRYLQNPAEALGDVNQMVLVCLGVLLSGSPGYFLSIVEAMSASQKIAMAKSLSQPSLTLLDALLHGRAVKANRHRGYELREVASDAISAAALVALWELQYLDGQPLTILSFQHAVARELLDRRHEVLPSVTLVDGEPLINAKAVLYALCICREFALANNVYPRGPLEGAVCAHLAILAQAGRTVHMQLLAALGSQRELGSVANFFNTFWRPQVFPVLRAALHLEDLPELPLSQQSSASSASSAGLTSTSSAPPTTTAPSSSYALTTTTATSSSSAPSTLASSATSQIKKQLQAADIQQFLRKVQDGSQCYFRNLIRLLQNKKTNVEESSQTSRGSSTQPNQQSN